MPSQWPKQRVLRVLPGNLRMPTLLCRTAVFLASELLLLGWAGLAHGEDNGEAFFLTTASRHVSVCRGSDAIFSVTALPISQAPTIVLNLEGSPAGASASFSQNPLSGDSLSSILTLSTGSVAPGTYSMALKGLAVTDTHAVRLMLAVGDLPPSAAVLLDPVAPQSDFPRDPILRWKQPGPAVNHIDVAEEPGFDNVVFTSAIDQVGSEREIQLPSLAPNTTHNWRVRSDNGCAAEAVSATGQFTTGQGHSLGNPRIAMPIGIPDNDPVGVQLSLDFDVSIAALTVELEILHSYVGDLQVELQHVDTGTTVRLLDRPASIWPEFPLGCPRENIHVRLKDTAAPDKNSLANLQCESLPAIGREYLDFNAEPSAWRDDYNPVEPLSAFSSEPFWGTWKLIVRDLQASDIGTLVSWCLEYQQGLRFCSHPGGTIPDNDSNGTISTMRLPFALTDLDVGPLNIAHSWVGDLAIDLNPPTGPARRILDRPGVPATPFGCSADNIGALILDDDGPSIDAEDTCSLTGDALAGRLRPTDLLNVVDGLPISGTWTFTVRDVSVNDFGIVSELALMPSGIEFHSGEEIFSDGFESDQPP